MPWTRSGSCPPSQCKGSCCRSIGIWFLDALYKPEMMPFLKLLQVKGVKVYEKDNDYLADIPFVCQYLTPKGLCGLHPDLHPNHNLPHRPEMCEDWPTEPAQLLNNPECGFTFVWKDEEIGVPG